MRYYFKEQEGEIRFENIRKKNLVLYFWREKKKRKCKYEIHVVGH